MQALILCGGRGTRLAEETEVRPKPMVEIGGRPLLWHIMKIYSAHGFSDFILCLGYKGDVIRQYFVDYHVMNSDVRVHVAEQRIEYLGAFHDEDRWTVLLAETGSETPTAARILRASRYIVGDRFMVTYGDGVANVDIRKLLAFHLGHGKLATVTGVRPIARFGELRVEGDRVVEFREKPQTAEGLINGGFFVFERRALEYMRDDAMLEREPLERLARDGQLCVYRHDGFWRAVDTLREKQALEAEWASGAPGWKVW